MKPLAIALLAGAAAAAAQAQMTPVGRWQSVDDKTGEPKAQMQILEQDGQLSGRIERLLRPGADPQARCTACTDERKDQPLVGLEIIRGAHKAEGRDVWEGGKILDPESGKVYTLRLTPVEGGSKLEVRGSVGPFWRTQTWLRQP
ncbi:DUF2147 domain-containing protein [Pseudorhodoferax sp.]|uniref:DUF2147 domain-containing protein n=1 Tax=Pseudorhodoferax sp. TaxID=1993553 RepID=UPI0039E22B55